MIIRYSKDETRFIIKENNENRCYDVTANNGATIKGHLSKVTDDDIIAQKFLEPA